MAHATAETTINAAAEDVWQRIRPFGASAEWHPLIESCQADGDEIGATRILTLPEGAVIRERLQEMGDRERFCTYTIVDGPLPLANYVATLRVKELDDHTCAVEWSSDFDPVGEPEADVVAAIASFYQTGLDNLKRILDG